MRVTTRSNGFVRTCALVLIASLSGCGGGMEEQPSGVSGLDSELMSAATPEATEQALPAPGAPRYSFTILESPGGNYSSANALNNAGQVVGCAGPAAGGRHATIWDATGARDLDPSSEESCAHSINNVGQVVGQKVHGWHWTTCHAVERWNRSEFWHMGIRQYCDCHQ
jgi:uncharacterized membrane protein